MSTLASPPEAEPTHPGLTRIATDPGPPSVVTASPPRRYRYVIAGAGCAGLSLAEALIEAGAQGSILLIDPRHHYINDRTWCFWAVEPTRYDDLCRKAWRRQMVVDADGREVVAASDRYPYRHLRAGAFYERTLGRLRANSQVTLRLGESVRGLTEPAGGGPVQVETDRATIEADFVFESGRPLSPEGARPGSRSPAPIALVQHFFGQTIRANRDVFDPGVATLMDFHVDQADGPRFVYVLPFDTRRALVENTYLSWAKIERDRHEREIATYLGDRHGLTRADYVVEDVESGRIPMTTAVPLGRPGPRRFRLGLQSGAARPSSGYAFLRIQRQTTRLAHALAELERTSTPNAPDRLPDPACIAPWKYSFFDTVFLKVLAEQPEMAGYLFRKMFQNARVDALLRFLSDRSGWLDDLSLIAALPKWPFIVSAMQSAPVWLDLLRRHLRPEPPERGRPARDGTSKMSPSATASR